MQISRRAWLALAGGALFVLSTPLGAAESKPTVLTIPNLCCTGCVKRVAAKLNEVKGVASVQYNLEAKQIIVRPKPDMTPSPKEMWEAAEKVNKKPSKLEGPSGTFTTKPPL